MCLLLDPNIVFSITALNKERRLFNTFNRQTLVEIFSSI